MRRIICGHRVKTSPSRTRDSCSRSWFTVVLDDPPGPDGSPQVPVCVDCLLDEHPRLGQGLDIAHKHRGAESRGDKWVPAPELWDA